MALLAKALYDFVPISPVPPITTIFICLFILLELKDLLFMTVSASGRLSFLLAIGFP